MLATSRDDKRVEPFGAFVPARLTNLAERDALLERGAFGDLERIGVRISVGRQEHSRDVRCGGDGCERRHVANLFAVLLEPRLRKPSHQGISRRDRDIPGTGGKLREQPRERIGTVGAQAFEPLCSRRG